MDTKLIQEITELKTEIKYIGKTLSKVEKVLENQGILLEKQNVANKRILDLEKADIERKKQYDIDKKESNARIRVLEDWKLRSITYATIFATIGSTIVGIIIKKIL